MMTLDKDPWLIYCLYRNQMENTLMRNDLFVSFESLISKLMVLSGKKEIVYSESNEGIFAKKVIYRLLEESSGYIADLKNGAFFASSHHTRALIELYATTVIVDSENGRKKRFLERFIRFPEVEYYKIYQKHKDSLLDLPEELLDKFFHQYSELKDDLLIVFNKKTKDELLEMQSWRGNCNIENLLEKLPDKTHMKNYDRLCLFTHFSSFARRSETELFPTFTPSNEEMLTITIKYAVDSYFYLRDKKYFREITIEQLDEVFSAVAPFLLPKLNRAISKIKL